MKTKFRISGMTCAACSARVEKVTKQINGASNIEVNLLAGTMVAEITDETVAEQIISAVSAAGYGAQFYDDRRIIGNNQMQRNDGGSIKKRIVISFAFLIALMYFTMGHMIGIPAPAWYHGDRNALVAALTQLMLTLPVVYLNRTYFTCGFKALFHRSPNMDSLIAVGAGASLSYSLVNLFVMADAAGNGDFVRVVAYSKNLYFESAAMILTLITFGKFLESRAKGKTGDAIRKLMDLAPKTAIVRRGADLIEIPVESVCIGDIVVVRSGGSIPVDGMVVSGVASIDQSALTGESVPVTVEVGGAVSAATINVEGYLEIKATRVGDETTLSKIIRMVEEAGGSKAPIARLADKISGIFVPVVMAISLVTFSVWMFAYQNFAMALNMGISVLVISCPCALGLATPVAIMVGTGRGASLGILFKNAVSLEQLHRIDTVVLDKTGTLTQGKPVVTKIIPYGISELEFLSVAAGIEAKSEHPFAKAIVDKAGKRLYNTAEDFRTIPGKGVCGVIEGVRYYGGNLRLMKELGVTVDGYEEYQENGKTPLYFASEDGRFIGVIIAEDVLKDDSAASVSQMQKMHLDVIMLSGDNSMTAEKIAENAGIHHVIADVLPGEKADVIARLQEEGRCVLMVGDGINDAPALTTADIGMAVSGGTDIAIESANIVLMNGSLLRVSDAIALSRATMRNIKQNLFWAFFYNILGIPVAAGLLYPFFGIQLSPMIGAAAMSMSSVFVVSNALRLRFFMKKSTGKLLKADVTACKENENMETIIYVEGMMCSHCKARVESACKSVNGVTDATVNLQEKKVVVLGSASAVELQKAIVNAGYEIIE